MVMQQNSPGNASPGPATTVDPAEVAKFSRLSDEWWDPKGKMAPLHKINPLRLSYIRDAACRKFERNVKSLNCLAGLRILDIGCGAGLLCEPFTRLGAQVIGVDPSASNIAAATPSCREGPPVDRLSLHHRRADGSARALRHRAGDGSDRACHRCRHVSQSMRGDAEARRIDGDLDLEPQLEEFRARHRRRGVCAALAAARHPSVGQVRHPRRTRASPAATTSSPSPIRPASSTARSPIAGVSPPTWT